MIYIYIFSWSVHFIENPPNFVYRAWNYITKIGIKYIPATEGVQQDLRDGKQKLYYLEDTKKLEILMYCCWETMTKSCKLKKYKWLAMKVFFCNFLLYLTNHWTILDSTKIYAMIVNTTLSNFSLICNMQVRKCNAKMIYITNLNYYEGNNFQGFLL